MNRITTIKTPASIIISTTVLTVVLTTLFLSSIITSQASAATSSAKTFSDVDDNEIYKTGIEFLASKGIVNGYPDGTYKPLITLNRAEMLKIIAGGSAKLNNLPEDEFDAYSSQNCFSDVKANQWFTKYVCYAKDKGWVEGYENGKYFRPSQNVTFVESLKITYKGMNISYNENATPWYKDLVELSSTKNLIPHTIKSFDENLKRNQMADMIARMIKFNEGEEILEEYLGNRADIVVTYETISKGQDLSLLEVEVITP